MAKAVIMPRQGQSVESCIVTKWHKTPGESVSVGDILFSYETDKSAFDEEAKDEGVLLARLFEEGDDVPVLSAMCVIGEAGEDISEWTSGAPKAAAEKRVSAPAAVSRESAPVAREEKITAGDAIRISPRARALAERTGALYREAQPSGPEGRILARDIQALVDAGRVKTAAAGALCAEGIEGTGIGNRVTLRDIESAGRPQPAAPSAAPQATLASQATLAPQAEPEYTAQPLTRMRKLIAQSMTASLSNMAQLTHNLSFDATQIQSVRASLKAEGEAMGVAKVTLNDMLLFAVSRVLKKDEHRALNAHLVGDEMRYFRSVNLGMAVDTPRGLMVPTLFRADSLSLLEISKEAKRLNAACQEGSISPDELSGGSFTVSNLGALGIESFTPVINPPQTGILGVNTIETRVRVVDGQMQAYPSMTLSLTYDHRALDGAPASRFLKDLKEHLERFVSLMAAG